VKYAVKAIQKSRVRDYETFQNEIRILKTLVPEFFLTIIGPSEHHKVVRDLGMAINLLLGYRVSITMLLTKNRYCEGGELFYFIL
jgi:hypothetical protein